MAGLPSARGSASAGTVGGQEFYRFTDASGREHIVNTEEGVPAGQRGSAQVIVLKAPETSSPPLDPRSVLVGLAAGIIMGIVAAWLLRARGPLPKMIVLAACGAALALTYLGLIRRSIGLSASGSPATPQTLVEDAKRAVESMNASVRERDEQIRQLQKEAK